MSKPAARIGDLHQCPMVEPGPKPHVGGPVNAGSGTVLVNNTPAGRVGDMAVCIGPPDSIAQGSGSVFMNGIPAARMGDSTSHGGKVVVGSPNVLIGDGGGGGGGTSPSSVPSSGPPKPASARSSQPGGSSQNGSGQNGSSQSSSGGGDNSGSENKATETPVCYAADLQLMCGHGKRGYVLAVQEGESSEFHVIAGTKDEKKEEITFNYIGSCVKGNPKCPILRVTGGPDGPEEVSAGGKIRVFPHRNKLNDMDWRQFFREFLFPNRNDAIRRYVASLRGCSKTYNYGATIYAHAPVGWNGSVKIGYFHGTHQDSNFNRNKGYQHLKVNGQWKVEGKLGVNYDEKIYQLVNPKKDGQVGKNGVSRGIFEGMQEFLNKVTPFFENLLGQNNASNIYTVNILWPMIEFGGKVRRQEIAGHADVGIEGDVHFGAMPLIGASVDMSILNLIIQLVATSTGLHPLGKLLREAKAIAKRGVNNDWVKASADIDIKLNVAGKIGGKVGWKAILGQEEWKPHGGSEMSGEVSFQLEGYAKAEVETFMVEASAGVSLSLKSANGKLATRIKAGFRALPGKGAEMNAFAEFNGLSLWYAHYAKAGVSSKIAVYWEAFKDWLDGDDDDDVPKPSRNGGDPNGLMKTKHQTKMKKELLTILKPSSWPSEDAANADGARISLSNGQM